jgi:hypothetical protein
MGTIVLFLSLQALFFVFFSLWFNAKLRRYADEDGMLAQARRDVASLIVELDGTTDRNVTIIEDKLTELKTLIADAEKRIALLARDKPQRSRAPEGYDRQGLALPFDGGDSPEQARPGTASAYAYAGALPDQAPVSGSPSDQAYLPQVHLKPRPASQAAAAPVLRQAPSPLAIDEPFPDRVMALYRRGMSSELIAARLSAPLSEVEIVVAMEEGRSRNKGTS